MSRHAGSEFFHELTLLELLGLQVPTYLVSLFLLEHLHGHLAHDLLGPLQVHLLSLANHLLHLELVLLAGHLEGECLLSLLHGDYQSEILPSSLW